MNDCPRKFSGVCARWVVVLICCLVPAQSFACLAPPESWSWSDDRLVACTQLIAVGKYDGTGFRVREVIRGKMRDKTKVLTVRSDNDNTDAENEIGINPDCSLSTKFEKGESYLVFFHSHHPKGYLKIKGNDDPWLLKIRRLGKTTAPGKKCGSITDENF